jgi:hypothetical protein
VGYRGNYAYNAPSTLNYALLVSGSVGIGTTSPADKLSVISGSVRIASSSLAGALYLGNDGNNIYLQRDNSYDLSLVQNGDSNSALYLASAGNVYVNIDSNNNDTDKAFIVQNNALKAGTELFRVSETGNVGIGTTSPVSKLHVYSGNGTAQIFNQLQLTNMGTPNTGDIVGIGFAAGESTQYGVKGSIGFIRTDTFGRGAITFYTNNTAGTETVSTSNERMRIDAGGNVGIGITSPTVRLHVSGSSIITNSNPGANSAVLLVQDEGTATTVKDGTTLRVVNNGSAADFSVFEASSAASNFVILNNGNVGIGTTTPATKFEMVGGEMAIKLGANTTSSFQWKNSSGTKIQEIRYDDSDGSMTLGGVGSYPIKFITSTTEKVRIAGDGNVGIGTTNPIRLLQVNSDALIYANVAGAITGSKLLFGSFANSTAASIYSQTTTATSGDLIFAPMSASILTEFVRIQSTGNVGIGTSSPTSKLTVVQSAGADSVLLDLQSNNDPGIRFGRPTFGSLIRHITATTDYIAFNCNGTSQPSVAATAQVVFDENGNVGIGTTVPVAKLQIAGNVSGSSFTSSISNAVGFLGTASWAQNVVSASFATTAQTANALNASNTYTIAGLTSAYVDVNGSGTIPTTGIYRPSTKTLGLSADGTLIFKISNVSSPATSSIETGNFVVQTGNVGIGTTSPAYKLDVKGNVFVANAADGNNTIAFGNIGTLGPLNGAPDNLTGSAFLVVSSSTASGAPSHMKFFTTTGGVCGERMRIDQSGNVGIGTTSPNAKLDVNGNAIVTGSLTTMSTIVARNYIMATDTLYIQKGVGGYQSYITAEQTAASTGNAFKFWNSGTSTLMTITYDGNVGIGTTLPVAKLQVAGNVSGSSFTSSISNAVGFLGTSSFATNATSASYAITSSVATNETLATVTGRGASTSTQITVATAVGGSMYTGRKAGSTYGDDVSGATFKSITDNPNGGSYAFASYYSGSTGFNSFFVAADGTGYFSGSVGIGTSSPANKLDVDGTFRATGTSTLAAVSITGTINSSATEAIRINNNSGYISIYNTAGTTRTGYIQGTTANALTIAAENGAVLQFNTSGSEKVRIDTNGNVGIGTTTGTFVLNVYNNADVWHARFGSATGELRIGGQTNNGAVIQSFVPGSGTVRDLYLQRDGGNVGIGTTVPTARLHVSGSTIITGSLNVSANITCLSLTETSTEAVKYNILPLTSQLDNVLKLKPVSFNYKTNDKHSIGLIAEDVSKVYPEFTSDNNDSISYGKITSVLIQSIKELKTIIDNQQKQIENLIDKLK